MKNKRKRALARAKAAPEPDLSRVPNKLRRKIYKKYAEIRAEAGKKAAKKK